MGTKRTQRRKMFNAGLHARKAFVRAHLSKELRAKMKKRAVVLKKGDNVRIARGKNTGKTGSVIKVNHKKGVIFVEGISRLDARGKDKFVGVQPSNVIVIETKAKEEKEAKKAQEQGG